MLADSHCHLQMGDGADALIERAQIAGVTRFLVPGTTLWQLFVYDPSGVQPDT